MATMVVGEVILLTTLISVGFAFPYPALEADNKEEALAKVAETVKNFNATAFFSSFRAPACVEECIDRIGALPIVRFDEGWSMEKTKSVCLQYDTVKSCMAEKRCSSMVVEVGMYVLEFLCNNDESNTGLLPCIRRESLKLHTSCERACKLGSTLIDAATITSKTNRTNVLNLVDEDGNNILTVPDLHTLCNTSTCFLSCMKKGVEEKCPNGGSDFVDKIANSVLRTATSNQFLPETKVFDAYSSLISSFLPSQCQYLITQERDIILTTPGTPFNFVTPPHQLVPTVAFPAQAPVDGNGGVEANLVSERNEEDKSKSETDSKKEGKNSSHANTSSVFLTTVLLWIVLRF